MTDLKYDKIDNPEDKTQRNEEVKNSSIKKRVIIDAGVDFRSQPNTLSK